MKKITLFIALLCLSFLSSTQDIAGTWNGELSVGNNKIPLVFHFTKDGKIWKGKMDSPAQGAKEMALDSVFFENGKLFVSLKAASIKYSGSLKNEKEIEGTFHQGGANLPLNLKRGAMAEIVRAQDPKPPFNYIIREVSFTNPVDGNNIAGTLTLPSEDKNVPLAVMITGSGPQDRNETIFNHKPFWVIADDFAKHGIGVLRMDDRGVGESDKGPKSFTTASFADDIQAAVKFLQGSGYTNIGLIGHSEGGMIAPMVASKNDAVKFIILMAAPGMAIDKLLEMQTYSGGKAEGIPEEVLKINKNISAKTNAFVKNYTGKNLEKDLAALLTKEFKALPKAMLPPEDAQQQMIQGLAEKSSSDWYRYFVKFSTDAYLSKIKIPVLAINGSLDVQVPAAENLKGIQQSLQKAGNKNVTLKELPGLNHLFQEAKTGAISEYAQIQQTISPSVLELMRQWILSLEK